MILDLFNFVNFKINSLKIKNIIFPFIIIFRYRWRIFFTINPGNDWAISFFDSKEFQLKED